MPMEKDNSLAGKIVLAATADQATKVNDTDARLPEIRQTGVVSDTGSVSEREEEGQETAVAVAVEESGSDLVGELPPRSSSARVPFTNLSQIDADLALARTLQEQERAYMMLSMNTEVSDYGSWETGSYVYDEDEFDDPENEDDDEYETDEDPQDEDAPDVNAREDDQVDDGRNSGTGEAAYSDDEAYARALQEAEEREMAARLSALRGLADHVAGIEDAEDESHTSQDAWDEMDPDELSYEELLALGEVVGTESRGLSADRIASLPSRRYKDGDNQNGTSESCVICRLDYEDDDELILLPCKHSYHSECINNWLKINKVCPVCSAEVSASSAGGS